MKNKDFEMASGNVFADLGVSHPEERLAKVKLALQINLLIEERGLTQKAAAELLQIDQPKISALSKGKLAGFSLERLFRFLNILGQTIVIKVSSQTKTKKIPHVDVSLQKIKHIPSLNKEFSRKSLALSKKK